MFSFVLGQLVFGATNLIFAVLAGEPSPNCNDAFVSQLNTGISTIVSLLTGVGVAIAVIGIIVGGLMRITSFGNERKIAASNTAITCAVIGLVIVLLSVAFGNSIPRWFNVAGCPL